MRGMFGGEGPTAVSLAAAGQMTGARTAVWRDASGDRHPMGVIEVSDEVTAADWTEHCWRHGITTNQSPARMVLARARYIMGPGIGRPRLAWCVVGSLGLGMWGNLLGAARI